MLLLFYLVCKCLPRCDVSYMSGWGWSEKETSTFLVATLVWMPPLNSLKPLLTIFAKGSILYV